MLGIRVANTCKSGSAMVMITPMVKLTRATKRNLRGLVMVAPMSSPIFIMDISAPMVNSPMPNISRTAPKRNSISVPTGIGEMITLNKNTMMVIGNTEYRASYVVSFSFFRIPYLQLLYNERKAACFI